MTSGRVSIDKQWGKLRGPRDFEQETSQLKPLTETLKEEGRNQRLYSIIQSLLRSFSKKNLEFRNPSPLSLGQLSQECTKNRLQNVDQTASSRHPHSCLPTLLHNAPPIPHSNPLHPLIPTIHGSPPRNPPRRRHRLHHSRTTRWTFILRHKA